ncbi:uncharacterized protein EDB93DRAFT_459881 [Suillus bovinus]|uniref:uncharacterized protein n=1 Tax=Suillus bovinus TaxID=48563 RepID=UPI001B8854D3|nr:uncharacterized protein EDB93DRAFT_459881 [Suillus bovinus]KAG2146971.1 hypothetical protein EDB93DRAFT_459881 [Suillus bovinus]
MSAGSSPRPDLSNALLLFQPSFDSPVCFSYPCSVRPVGYLGSLFAGSTGSILSSFVFNHGFGSHPKSTVIPLHYSCFGRGNRDLFSSSAVMGRLCGVHVPFPDDRITHKTGRSGGIMLMMGEGLMEAVVALVYRDRRTGKKVIGKLPGVCSRSRATAEWSMTYSGLDVTSVTHVVETVMGGVRVWMDGPSCANDKDSSISG